MQKDEMRPLRSRFLQPFRKRWVRADRLLRPKERDRHRDEKDHLYCEGVGDVGGVDVEGVKKAMGKLGKVEQTVP